ncbi:DNA-binding transcriptional MocR family regulator [Friedmanniella endophytica]|uniref:DNA-binding transcriptional MocR family regulator n=1 Tax=Microlunatus kandeliicorticis TaxID=1759536 RepID=A0A7W3P4M2_9ACTN|nr:aminotransferase class I/II-fold pyridoxal phosphate-dependent enzyme [Microlunatus kandeliicorticis]MBA8793049.1 DNA-binding transcriptional MocR family regulator [Microlunatus kandeliicorticis]
MLSELSRDQLTELHGSLRAGYDELRGRGLSLDLTRGKPSAQQLDLSNGLLELPGPGVYRDAAGTDLRNYGGLTGLPELRAIFGELLNLDPGLLVAANNSSLAVMHDSLVFSLLHGPVGAERPWKDQPVTFLCPTPGYDRHFALTDSLGIRMVPVGIGPDGPDVDEIARLVADDPSVKGLWAVPTYANPTGAVYTPEVVRALVSMPTAAPDFRILWDNAYALHHLTDREITPVDVLGLAAEAGHPDRVFGYASTSKITFAGGGVAFFAASKANLDWYLAHLGKRTIGPDKINQLRHVLFFGDAEGVRSLMRRHRGLIAEKFAVVDRVLSERLGEHGVAHWTEPEGGYFISLDVADHTATRVVALCKEAGIAMTPAGSAFPYGRDPRDRNIRIAPTFPPLDQVAAAIDGLATCVLLAAVEARLAGDGQDAGSDREEVVGSTSR